MIEARWPGSGARMTWAGDPLYLIEPGGRLVRLETPAPFPTPQPRKAPMTLRIAIVNGSAEELDALADELDAVAVRHQRAAMAAAVELENDDSLKDKRTGALAIFKTLAEAGRFTTWAIEVRDHRDAELEYDPKLAAARLDELAGEPVAPSLLDRATDAVRQIREGHDAIPDHAPDAAPTREEVLAGVEAHVAAVNGHDPDGDLPTAEELEEARLAALGETLGPVEDPIAEDGDR